MQWSAEADRAFGHLGSRAGSSGYLFGFIVEVDTSEAGIGTMLCQRTGTPPKLSPCAFFLKKLNPVERNYDVGDRELLAVVKALKDWRH